MSRVEKLLLFLLPLPFGIGFLAPGPAPDPVAAETVFHFTDPDVVESSGLVARDGLVVTVNDSGDSNRIFTVDPATGDTVGVTRWQGEGADNEALAPAGDGQVYVGDIGDNAGSRDSVEVAKVPFGRGEREVRATTYELVYPDGPHDAETLLTDPATGRLYVVAKAFIGRVYAAPETLDPDRPNELTPVEEVLGIATDGSFLPDGKHVLLRNYTQAALYTWPALDRVALLDLPEQQQGEGLAVREDGAILLSSEGKEADVLRVELPPAVQDRLDAPPARPDSPDNPASSPVVKAEERSRWPWLLGGTAALAAVAAGLTGLSRRRRGT